MTLLHATMIAGLAAVVLPLLLQRIGRTRVRRVEWGAMMFLEDSSAAAALSGNRRERILLLVRMLMIAALAVALAQPVAADATAAQGPGLTVIVLDRSGSMSVDTAGKSRLDVARHAALNILAALPAGDEAAVIFAPEAFGSTITADFQQVASRISDIRQSSGRADLAGALNTAAKLLDSSRANRRNLFLISDRQAGNFRDMSDRFADTFRAQWGVNPPKLRFIPIGTPADNCGLIAADVIDPQAVVGKAITIEIKATNYGTSTRTDLPLTVSIGDQILDTSMLTIPAGGTITTRRSIRLSAPGSQLLTLKIAEDAYIADDTLDLALLVQPADGAARPPPDQNLSVGDPIIADLPGASPEHVSIEGPGGGAVDVISTPQGPQARFSGTGRPGTYRLHYQTAAGAQTLHFVVRGSRDESDLTNFAAVPLTRLLHRFGFESIDDPTPAIISRELNPTRLEPWTVLLSLTVALAVVEAALSRLWLAPMSRGARA